MNGGINGFPSLDQQQQMIIRQDTNSFYRSAKSKSTSSTYSSSSSRSSYNKLQQYRGSSSCIPPSFQIPHTKLLPIHSTIYNYLFITYCISITSLSQAIQRPTRSNEKLVISCISINLILSFILCIGYRYTPFRMYIVDTHLYLPSICQFRYYEENDSSLLDGGITIELVIGMLVYLFQLISFGIITSSSSNNSSSYLGIDNNFEIWNNNLYHGTWVSMMLSSFLIADLLTTDTNTSSRAGTEKDGLVAKYTTQYMKINTISRSYLLLLISTICLLSFSTSQSTSTTNRAIGIAFGTLGLIIAMIYWLLCTYTNRRRDYWLLHPRGSSQLIKIDSNKTLISCILSFIGFICYLINAGFVTSTTSYSANVYFSSWICFGMCIYLCIQHLKVYMVPSSQLYIHSLMQVYDDERRNILLSSRRRSSYSSRSSYSRSSSQEGGRLRIQGDDALTAMVESRSEDGPMVFLPIENDKNYNNRFDDDDDASYPSVSPRYLRRPQGQQQMEPEDSVNGIRRQQVPTRLAPQGPRQGNSGGGSNHTPPPKRQNTQGTGGSLTSDFVETMYSDKTPPGSYMKIMPPPPPRRNSGGDYSMSEGTSIGRKSRSSSKSPQSFDSPSRRRRSKSPNTSRRTQSPRSFRSYETQSRKTSVKSSPSFNNSRASSRSSLDDGTSYGPSTVSGGGTRGPSTASFGAATMSASGGGSQSEKHEDEQGEKITMGRIQPRAPPPPPPPHFEEEEENEEDYYDANGFDIRPFKTIHHSSLENMSTVSDISHPSADRFDTFHEPRGNTNKGATTRNNVEGSDQKLRYSNEDLNEGQKNVRQGAVDQMVMEALRQASNRGPSNPPPTYGLLPAGMSKGNRRNSTGSRVSFSKDIKETMIYNADSGINSGGQQQQRNGASMRSFYSHQSGAASYDDDAGDEYDC